MSERLKYRLLTGPDDATFCERVSKALEEGYELYGSPAITFDGKRCIVAQAVVLRTDLFDTGHPRAGFRP
jgi:hypothetical protein